MLSINKVDNFNIINFIIYIPIKGIEPLFYRHEWYVLAI